MALSRAQDINREIVTIIEMNGYLRILKRVCCQIDP